MRRTTAIIVALALPLLVVAVAHAEVGDHQARLVTADEPVVPESTTTSTSEATEPTTTTSEPEVTSTTSTSTTEPHHESTTTTTSTTVKPHEAPALLTLACVSDGPEATVSCHWDGVPDGTTKVVLLREQPTKGPAQPLWSTDDPSVRDHDDDTAIAGTTYVYRVSAFDGDTFLETSNPVRIKAGGGTPDAAPTPTIDLTCAATGEHTVHCAWGAAPAGTAHWRLLRTIDATRGRVVGEFAANVHAADDTDVPAGQQQYLIQAVDGGGKVLGYGRAVVDCCAAVSQ